MPKGSNGEMRPADVIGGGGPHRPDGKAMVQEFDPLSLANPWIFKLRHYPPARQTDEAPQ
jgi:hypothetical protein